MGWRGGGGGGYAVFFLSLLCVSFFSSLPPSSLHAGQLSALTCSGRAGREGGGVEEYDLFFSPPST
jgi:hypothetical protein